MVPSVNNSTHVCREPVPVAMETCGGVDILGGGRMSRVEDRVSEDVNGYDTSHDWESVLSNTYKVKHYTERLTSQVQMNSPSNSRESCKYIPSVLQSLNNRNCLHCDQIVDSSKNSTHSNTAHQNSLANIDNNVRPTRGANFRPLLNHNGEHFHQEEHHFNQKVKLLVVQYLNVLLIQSTFYSICVTVTVHNRLTSFLTFLENNAVFS